MSESEPARLSESYHQAAEQLRPHPEQWQIYESEGNCVIRAGPGSGKTKILTIKMARMLNEDVAAPQGMACITYSNECARELNRRLRHLRVRASSRVFIGTTHGLCLQHILRPYSNIAKAGLPDPFQIASPSQQAAALQRAMDDVLPYPEKESSYRASTFDRYRRTFMDRSHPSWKENDEHASAVIERYEQLLRTNDLIDFDDMVLVGLRLVREHDWVRRALACRFPIMVVDEYQDLGPPLHQMVLLLMETGVRILAVGDPDQSIYGFTGADPRLLEELGKRDDVEEVLLKLNFRSRKEIVDGSQVILREARGYEPAAAVEDTSDVGVIDFVLCPEGLNQQAQIILEQLVPRALAGREGRCLGDVAILYPNRYVGDAIADAADERDILTVRIDQGAHYPKTPLTRWIEDCASWCAGGWAIGEPSLSSILYWWSTFGRPGGSSTERWEMRVKLARFLWRHREPKALLATWLRELFEDIVAEILIAGGEARDEIEAWDKLQAACGEGSALAEWTVDMFGGQVGSSDYLNLITLHSAKGLEFDVVVMMGMDQGIIPPYRAETDEAKREPRRLFYVGMTRARHEVYMTFSGFTTNQWGTRFERGPSEFLLELQAEIDVGKE